MQCRDTDKPLFGTTPKFAVLSNLFSSCRPNRASQHIASLIYQCSFPSSPLRLFRMIQWMNHFVIQLCQNVCQWIWNTRDREVSECKVNYHWVISLSKDSMTPKVIQMPKITSRAGIALIFTWIFCTIWIACGHDSNCMEYAQWWCWWWWWY